MTAAGASRTSGLAPRGMSALLVVSVLSLDGCATRRLPLPSGPGTPFPDYASAFDEASRRCRDVRSLTAELAVSGRVGTRRLRGRVLAGLARPSSVRLEGVAPFGPPAFILTATDDRSTLLLPRDDRVLQDAPPAAIIEALAGVSLPPDDLRALLAGCLVADLTPIGGRRFGSQWAAVDFGGRETAYLQLVDDKWRIVAAEHGPLHIEYADQVAGQPATVRLRTPTSELTLKLSQLDLNVAMEPGAFTLPIPPRAVPMTLEELRDAGPLGTAAKDRKGSDRP